MEKNVGKKDGYVRYVLGVILIVLAYLWNWWLLIPAAVMVLTAYFGMCGLYKLFGINTCKLETK